MHSFFKFTGLCILLILNSELLADETGYEVELIIFEDASSRYLHSEDWSYNDMLQHAKGNKSSTVKTPDSDPQFKFINWESAKLAPNLKKLTTNSNYKILLNKRWRQTGLDRDNTYDIGIDTRSKEQNTEQENPQLQTENRDITSSYLTGTVKLIMSRYLHFNVNLHYFKPQKDEFDNPIMVSYPVVNERRMRSREIHYIDHPLVGIVILVTPYKIKMENDIPNTNSNEYKTLKSQTKPPS